MDKPLIHTIAIGMPSSEVLRLAGAPQRTARDAGEERWFYRNGRVEIVLGGQPEPLVNRILYRRAYVGRPRHAGEARRRPEPPARSRCR